MVPFQPSTSSSLLCLSGLPLDHFRSQGFHVVVYDVHRLCRILLTYNAQVRFVFDLFNRVSDICFSIPVLMFVFLFVFGVLYLPYVFPSMLMQLLACSLHGR